ncbi:MAG TPA: cupin domain-containing protein [Steroidobacteraceae bacterium]|nr:cupin domain-containing protein [Steroidobacteraceae bacterium]
MLFPEAQRTLQQLLAPLTLDEFLDKTLSGGFCRIDGAGATERLALLGPDPRAVLIEAFHLAPKLTFHSANPSGPAPSLEGVADAADFRARIEEFHARNYSVRFPELRPLWPRLDRLARALELMLHQPVTTSAFWSRAGMRAPVHYDDHDLIVVQLLGEKRWYVANSSDLPNTWRGIPADSVELGDHSSFDVHPGDVVYLPRGTLHSVTSDAESLHLSIGFTPLTLREALIAALDQLSDVDPALRATVGGRLAYQLRGVGVERLAGPVLDGVERLRAACRTPGFLAAALQHRSSRVVARLAALPAPSAPPPLDLDSELTHTDVAFCHLTASPEKIDFSHPGGHLYIHRGAEQSLLFMVNTPRFRVRDIPGEIADDVRLSLAGKLVEIGFLELAPDAPERPAE